MMDWMMLIGSLAMAWYAGFLWGHRKATQEKCDIADRAIDKACSTLRMRIEHVGHQNGHGVGTLDRDDREDRS